MNIKRYYKPATILIVELILSIIYGVFLHWGHVRNPINKSDVAVIYNDMAKVANGSTIKLRPGIYEFRLVGPRVEQSKKKVVLWPFATYSISADIKERTDASIVGEITGKKVSSGDVVTSTYENNWLFATIRDGEAMLDIAGRYDALKWQKAYDNKAGVDDYVDVAQIPEKIARLITESISKYGLDEAAHGD